MKDFLIIFAAILFFQLIFRVLFGLTPEDLFWLFIEMIESVRNVATDRWALIFVVVALALPPLAYLAWRSAMGHSR